MIMIAGWKDSHPAEEQTNKIKVKKCKERDTISKKKSHYISHMKWNNVDMKHTDGVS